MNPIPKTLRIASDVLGADISTLGAELQNLADASGRSLQWDGDPAFWTGRAPILFPIVGTLANGRYRHEGREYAMGRHGFARQSTFEVIAHEDRSAALRLRPNDATRAAYPFEFRLDVVYTMIGSGVSVVATITNEGGDAMPASLGFHPALRWPLPYGQPRAEHAIRFAQDEPAPVRRLDGDGLLSPERHPTPVVGDTLALRDELFAADALILDGLASRRVRYGASTGPQLEVSFDDLSMLGLWSKPGSGFVCIEPWQGVSDPAGFDGDLRDKPGIVVIAPGEARSFAMTIALDTGSA